ncbi:unnamed protein product [Urochloa humidicola]
MEADGGVRPGRRQSSPSIFLPSLQHPISIMPLNPWQCVAHNAAAAAACDAAHTALAVPPPARILPPRPRRRIRGLHVLFLAKGLDHEATGSQKRSSLPLLVPKDLLIK